MINKPFEIDLVYLWVDGNDPTWRSKKSAFTGEEITSSENDFRGRYSNNDELRYSLRSVEKHIPWVRKIFVVTDNQIPDWLDIVHPKIAVIDHSEILPSDALPCFNSSVIEYFLYKIPGLSEHFLYANDDMFVNADLPSTFFFTNDGIPIVRLKKKLLGKWNNKLKLMVRKRLGQYSNMVNDSANLIDKKFGKYYSSVPHHNIDAYLKSDYQEAVEMVFKPQVLKSQHSKLRAYGDLHRSAFSYYLLAIGHGILKYVNRKEASRILIHRHDFNRYMKKYQPILFCLNDNQRVNDRDRESIRPFLESLFPIKSAFEK